MLAWRERYNDLFGEGEAALASAFLVPTDTPVHRLGWLDNSFPVSCLSSAD